MTRRPAHQPPASPCGSPAARQEQPSSNSQDEPGAHLDARVAELVAGAPSLTSAQRDQLALILRRRAAPRAANPARPDPISPTASDETLIGNGRGDVLSISGPAWEAGG